MAISTLHRLDRIALPSSVNIDQIKSAKWSAGAEAMLEYAAGHTHPQFVATMKQSPTLEFSTSQLSTLLAAVGVGGIAPAAITTYLKAASTTGNVARATTGHKRLVINSSVVYWTQIRLPHNGEGEAQVVIACNFDGTNAPFVYTGSVALAGNQTAAEHFGCGPVSINGSAIPGVQEVTISSGIQLVQEGGESEVYNTFTGIEQTRPTITIQTREMINWSTIGLAGTALNGSTGVVVYARKFAANGQRVANATTEHISFQGLLGQAIPQDTSGDGGNVCSDTILCNLVASSDSVLPLLTSTGVAIV